MAKKPLLTVEERTTALIEGWRGLPGEFGMLKGLLCASIAIGAAARAKTNDYAAIEAEETIIDRHINRYRIAARIDELRAEERMDAQIELSKLGG